MGFHVSLGECNVGASACSTCTIPDIPSVQVSSEPQTGSWCLCKKGCGNLPTVVLGFPKIIGPFGVLRIATVLRWGCIGRTVF